MSENEFFHVGQKGFIEKDGELLVLTDSHGELDLPGGRIQEGEKDAIESMKREVREECGLEIEVISPFTTWIAAFPEGHKLCGKRVYLIGYRCAYKSGQVVLSDEHTKFRWVNRENFHEADDGTTFFRQLKKYFE